MAETYRKRGVAEPTFHRWSEAQSATNKYLAVGVPEIRRLKQLEEENIKLEQLVADLSLDKSMVSA